MRRSNIPITLVTAWAVIVGAGVFALAKHAATPGASPPAAIDPGLPLMLGLPSDKMTLVMFVHPKCPCSDASIEELSTLMMRCGDRVHAFVVIAQSGGEPADWSRTALGSSVRRIPGVEVRADRDAALARKCGALTSGQVFLYDKSGGLLFTGGITGSRGHVGDNDGLDAVAGLILAQGPPHAPRSHAPVFGCAIYTSTDNKIGSLLTKAKQ